MEEKENVKERKCARKQKRAFHRLARDMNIVCCDEPTQNLVVCNGGLVTGLKREKLAEILDQITDKYVINMPSGKSYCFLKFSSEKTALNVYEKIHGRVLKMHDEVLYLTFAKSIPDSIDETLSIELPPGLKIIPDFITPEEELKILEKLDWNEAENNSGELKHRKVKHFGYEFRYDTNKVDPDEPITPIPQDYSFLQELFQKHNCGDFEYDQLTINHYSPGQGIPPHIDTHSVFEDPILSLSLSSGYIMDFRRFDKRISLLLPPRSLLVMSGEARYAWTHGICPRHNDVITDEFGSTTRERGTRISFTFRKVKRGNCQCNFPQYCDIKNHNSIGIDQSVAPGLENSYVHEVYEEIAGHFSETRHQQWPNVASFLDTIEPGGILLDVGCGNGKYLTDKPGIFKIGCDRSSGLAGICRKKSFEVLLSDCLQLPFKSNSLDAIICIAVIHHLATPERRRDAFLEILRVLRPNGRCLIYVWAKEQNRNSKESTYLRFNPKKTSETGTKDYRRLFESLTLPVHENRTNFEHSDVLVPWKRKGGGEFLRYYHVFEELEFVELCEKLPISTVEKIYYDQGNWCTILKKNI